MVAEIVAILYFAKVKFLTNEGEKPIEEIEVGDRVLAKDEETGEVAYKEVVGLFQKQADEIYYVHIGDEIIEVTGEHPFWLDGKGWTFVKDLKVGDLLVTSGGATLAIDKIEKEPREATVYNFEVADFHSYFVSNLGIWVHNCAVKSIRGAIKDKGLPTDGRFHFMADGDKVEYNKSLGGYVDRHGNVWKKGPYHGDPNKDFSYEWDVQLSEKGMKAWGHFTKNGKKYINITPDGNLSH